MKLPWSLMFCEYERIWVATDFRILYSLITGNNLFMVPSGTWRHVRLKIGQDFCYFTAIFRCYICCYNNISRWKLREVSCTFIKSQRAWMQSVRDEGKHKRLNMPPFISFLSMENGLSYLGFYWWAPKIVSWLRKYKRHWKNNGHTSTITCEHACLFHCAFWKRSWSRLTSRLRLFLWDPFKCVVSYNFYAPKPPLIIIWHFTCSK